MSSTKLQSPTKLIPVPKPRSTGQFCSTSLRGAHQLLVEQREEWPMLRRDYASLPAVQTPNDRVRRISRSSCNTTLPG